MEYLDPKDGWRTLWDLTGDLDAVEEQSATALRSLQGCLDGQAVHGDLNPSNIFVRYSFLGAGNGYS